MQLKEKLRTFAAEEEGGCEEEGEGGGFGDGDVEDGLGVAAAEAGADVGVDGVAGGEGLVEGPGVGVGGGVVCAGDGGAVDEEAGVLGIVISVAAAFAGFGAADVEGEVVGGGELRDEAGVGGAPVGFEGDLARVDAVAWGGGGIF